MNYSELQIAYEFLGELETSGNLKTLHIRIPQLAQSNINTIASSFETLTALSLSNANITEPIDFSPLSRLEELKLVDITLGQVSNLPLSLRALVATISYVDSKRTFELFKFRWHFLTLIGLVVSCRVGVHVREQLGAMH